MSRIAFGEYTIPPLTQKTTANYKAFSWVHLRNLGWDVGYVEPRPLIDPPTEQKHEENIRHDPSAVVDEDFVSIVEEVIAHRT